MKKLWKTLAFLGTAAAFAAGALYLFHTFFEDEEDLDDFDEDLFDEDDDDDVDAFEDESEIFEDELS